MIAAFVDHPRQQLASPELRIHDPSGLMFKASTVQKPGTGSG